MNVGDLVELSSYARGLKVLKRLEHMSGIVIVSQNTPEFYRIGVMWPKESCIVYHYRRDLKRV